ncbi:glycerate kinase type-2 family protein [Halomonas halocynthiae]|uniref:glycerate kinase type-2 family protein n=1 Tax=Halomonas halocynthiae TaxID=176290 RepID=UPI00041D317C|nr:glycerate kinase [Halomonas halocynthiae]
MSQSPMNGHFSQFDASVADDPVAVRDWLVKLSEAGVRAVHPDTLLPDQLPQPPRGRTLVVGAGKAAAAMAAALERAWQMSQPDAPLSGLVVTRYGHGPQHAADCQRIEVLEASHPMPDNLSERAAKRMLEAVDGLSEDDLVIALISGGGSALMTLPADGVSLSEKQSINHHLLRSGAPIRDINTVRRHLSAIKGGRLAAAAHPARVLTWLISDVPGDEASLIASGPTLADSSTPQQALEILESYSLPVSDDVRHHLANSCDWPTPDAPEFARDQQVMLARAKEAMLAARAFAESYGVTVDYLGDDLEGEARELGRRHARLALEHQRKLSSPLLILSGGETSVTVVGDGRGGRNVEYLLGVFDELKGASNIYALAIDTDGIDGSEDNAGAVFGPEQARQATKKGLDAETYLLRNDAYTFFSALDALLVTGPTRTNVNDLRAILVLPRTP